MAVFRRTRLVGMLAKNLSKARTLVLSSVDRIENEKKPDTQLLCPWSRPSRAWLCSVKIRRNYSVNSTQPGSTGLASGILSRLTADRAVFRRALARENSKLFDIRSLAISRSSVKGFCKKRENIMMVTLKQTASNGGEQKWSCRT
jgi:hypothetical protein